ncbi:hypothetical protein BD289DRAFT_278372 [Coniella lustricola]|uniref:Uncharacterized protein n=1 Tax=Coniella lustricola TaxID=2025994 RepID=A0A2T3A6E2_9PEZI|nr:hypothetical protein BD289DRAFT_278372 [Coniella lustricola]
MCQRPDCRCSRHVLGSATTCSGPSQSAERGPRPEKGVYLDRVARLGPRSYTQQMVPGETNTLKMCEMSWLGLSPALETTENHPGRPCPSVCLDNGQCCCGKTAKLLLWLVTKASSHYRNDARQLCFSSTDLTWVGDCPSRHCHRRTVPSLVISGQSRGTCLADPIIPISGR